MNCLTEIENVGPTICTDGDGGLPSRSQSCILRRGQCLRCREIPPPADRPPRLGRLSPTARARPEELLVVPYRQRYENVRRRQRLPDHASPDH